MIAQITETQANQRIISPITDIENIELSPQALRLACHLHAIFLPINIIKTFVEFLKKSLKITSVSFKTDYLPQTIRIGSKARFRINYIIELENYALGEIEITCKTPYKDMDIALIEHYLQALIYPLRNAILYQEALASALHDPLTGVANRNAYSLSLNTQIKTAKQKNKDFSVLLIDIDNFKKINDTHGHCVGDEILKSVCNRIKTCTREQDKIFRIGGEEFFISMAITDNLEAKRVAKRICECVAASTYSYKNLSLHVTISIGVAFLEKQDSRHSLFVKADNALYRAKAKGGNCYCS